MKRVLTVLVWAIFVASASGVFFAARALSDTGRRGFEYMPDMSHSLPYDSFAPNPVTRDGKTLQAPVSGTVPRGFEPFRYDRTPADALRAGEELQNPVPASEDNLRRGRALYEAFCAVCHGARGRGDGPVAAKIPPPAAYTSERVRAMAPGQLFHVITRGSGRMPPYAAQIPAAERWLIVSYVETLKANGSTRP